MGKTLTEMLGDAGFGYGTDDSNAIKEVFAEWLKEVGLPDRYISSIDGRYNTTESIRKLLITLVDEP